VHQVEPKESRVPDEPVAGAAPPSAGNAQPFAERDTLQEIRIALSQSPGESERSLFECDTEPGLDARILREALRAGLK
jgi:hypothetical protein